MHSFRHSMRDRLKAVECSSDVTDQIGGWLTQGVGASYELGHNHRTLTRWLISIVEAPNLETQSEANNIGHTFDFKIQRF